MHSALKFLECFVSFSVFLSLSSVKPYMSSVVRLRVDLSAIVWVLKIDSRKPCGTLVFCLVLYCFIALNASYINASIFLLRTKFLFFP